MEVDEPHVSSLFMNDGHTDDDDEIAYTMPIYLSHHLSPSLQLFQYPLHDRPVAPSPYAQSQGKVITARVKEAVERVEVVVPVDTRPEVWDEEKAQEMGFQHNPDDVKPFKKGKSASEPKDQTASVKLISEPIPHVTSYFGGLIHNDALHIHPISKTVQLRPFLGHLDEVDRKKRSEEARRKSRGGGGGGDEDDSDDDDDEEAGPSKGKKAGGDELKNVTASVSVRFCVLNDIDLTFSALLLKPP